MLTKLTPRPKSRSKAQAQPRKLSPQLLSRSLPWSIVIALFYRRSQVASSECHMMKVEILSHLISLHQAKKHSPDATAWCRVPPDAASASKNSMQPGGVTSTHAISTSSPLCNGSRRPMSASRSDSRGSRPCSGPVPAMHRRQVAAVMWLAGSGSCGVASRKQMPALSEGENPRGQRHPRACSSRRATRSEEDVSNGQARPFPVA